jgi:hypothetical protein
VSNRSDNLLRRDADIAVRFFRPDQDDVIAVPVGRTELGLYAHESYLARHGEPRDFDIPRRRLRRRLRPRRRAAGADDPRRAAGAAGAHPAAHRRHPGPPSHVVDHHMEIAPKSASHNAPAPLAPSISRQRTLHRKSSNFHRWGQMHVCHLAEH